MVTPKVIARINELARKQRECGLSEAERVEQAQLRRLYIDNIKNQVKAHLDAAKIHRHEDGCSCGCRSKH